MEQKSNELDPRIQIELENLNTATEEINKLEIELEEADSTFHILLNESTRRLKLLTKKLGSCIEKSAPYYESMEKARLAQIECQVVAAKFQRANEIHAAAKETVALAEERFLSNSHNWTFDNTWQEMLNHATNKVMEAEKQKAECHAEHQRKAHIFSRAEMETQQIEERQRRNIQKSRPYFEEKQLCQDQLQTQRDRITELEIQIKATKAAYATSLKNLEQISEEIHRTRANDLGLAPPGRREPGVGAELCEDESAEKESPFKEDYQNKISRNKVFNKLPIKNMNTMPIVDLINQYENDYSLETASLDTNSIFSEDKDEDDYAQQLDECVSTPKRNGSLAGAAGITTNSRNEPNSAMSCENHELNLEELRQKVKVLAVRPVEGGDGQTKDCWESELNETVNKLDRLMMLQENIVTQSPSNSSSGKAVAIVAPTPHTTPTMPAPTPVTSKNYENTTKLLLTPQSQTPITQPKPVQAHGGISMHATHVHTTALPPLPPNSSSTKKTFLNNSLHAVQQKMDELLPMSQTSSAVMHNMKELPLLSRISNEISANTANTVKVLKRRLSLN